MLARGMSKKVKKKIAKTVIWSVALYSAETWSLRKEDIRRKKHWECEYMEKEGCGNMEKDGTY